MCLRMIDRLTYNNTAVCVLGWTPDNRLLTTNDNALQRVAKKMKRSTMIDIHEYLLEPNVVHNITLANEAISLSFICPLIEVCLS